MHLKLSWIVEFLIMFINLIIANSVIAHTESPLHRELKGPVYLPIRSRLSNGFCSLTKQLRRRANVCLAPWDLVQKHTMRDALLFTQSFAVNRTKTLVIRMHRSDYQSGRVMTLVASCGRKLQSRRGWENSRGIRNDSKGAVSSEPEKSWWTSIPTAFYFVIFHLTLLGWEHSLDLSNKLFVIWID